MLAALHMHMSLHMSIRMPKRRTKHVHVRCLCYMHTRTRATEHACLCGSFYETVVPPAFEPYLPAAVCIAALGALAAGLASLRRR